VSGVPERGVKRGDLTSEQSANWIWAAEKVSKWKLHVERNPDPRAIVARAKALSAEGDLALVVVDYLQRTKTGAREMWQDMAAATGTLQDGAVDLDIPFVVLSQPTTEARRSGKAIKASDTKGGGTAEEDGDLVLLLAKGVHDPGAAGLAILAGRDVEPKVWHAESCVVDGKSVAACGWRWNYRSMRLESR
jgi:replicative DNA helicase